MEHEVRDSNEKQDKRIKEHSSSATICLKNFSKTYDTRARILTVPNENTHTHSPKCNTDFVFETGKFI